MIFSLSTFYSASTSAIAIATIGETSHENIHPRTETLLDSHSQIYSDAYLIFSQFCQMKTDQSLGIALNFCCQRLTNGSMPKILVGLIHYYLVNCIDNRTPRDPDSVSMGLSHPASNHTQLPSFLRSLTFLAFRQQTLD